MTADLLFLALVLDAALGEPRWLWSRLPHPAVVMGRLIGWMDRTWNTGGYRRARGIAAVALLVLGAAGLGALVSRAGPVAEVLLAAILLAQRSLVDHVRAVATGLRQDLAQGRAMVARIVSRETGAMTPPDVTRAAIESAAENLSDGVIAPAFWFLVGGLPGILIYKAVNTADSMIGYLTPRHAEFGWAAARLDDALNLIPARLTAGLIWVVGGMRGDWSEIYRDAARHKSPNAGWPEAAMARALGIALAGPRVYDGTLQGFPFVNGRGRRASGADDIDGAVGILWRAWAATLIAVLLIALA